MAYILNRTEGDIHTVIFKYAALEYYLTSLAIVLTFISAFLKDTIFFILTAIFWVIAFVLAAPTWPTLLKLSKHKKSGNLEATGSRWSFSNPPKFVWKE